MITKNKLSDQPENRLTNKFRPIDMDEEGYEELPGGKPHKPRHLRAKKKVRAKTNAKTTTESSAKNSVKKKWISFLLLVLLLLGVAAATYGMACLMKGASSESSEGTEATEEEEEGLNTSDSDESTSESPEPDEENHDDEKTASIQPITSAPSSNPTIQYGRLMLINPNFMVDSNFISARKQELVSLQSTYGILELHASNGDNLIDKEAAQQINKMLSDYTIANPGHSIQTVSCFREIGTNCGRLCMPTGASDHHTGLTCDLIDPVYGTSLDTATYEQHFEWQWLRANSYKYGFIDRFPEAWAGGSMEEPMNVNAEGSTGLYETWHFRYVGIYAATEIATGVYNNGQYDSLEHYLKARGLVTNLLNN